MVNAICRKFYTYFWLWDIVIIGTDDVLRRRRCVCVRGACVGMLAR